MFDWLRRKVPLRGCVFFRGAIPPTEEGFARIADAGLTVRPTLPESDDRWRLALDHPDWGRAELACPRDFEPIPSSLIDFAWLSEAEKADARHGESGVFVEIDAPGENILRERKVLLRFLDAVAGDDAVAVFDIAAQRLWSKADLQDELSHDADLDVMSLMTLHAVSNDDGEIGWIHSHGLASLGLVDFDLVQPDPWTEFAWNAEAERTIAAAILEGEAGEGSGPFQVAFPDGYCELVGIDQFLKTGAGHAGDLLRELIGDGEDEEYDYDHLDGHVVVCEPAPAGMVSRLFSSNRPQAVRFLWEDGMEDGMTCLSTGMTGLMAARARATYGVLRAMYDEFRDFGFTVLAKLGYEVDSDPDELEHMWFAVHAVEADAIDATLLNEPFDVSGMKHGARARHPAARLTDWTIFTPVGAINPRSFTAARKVREDPDAVRAMMEDEEG